MLGPFGLGLGHGPIWPLTFLAKLALHNITATRVCRLQPVGSMATRKACEGEGECRVEPQAGGGPLMLPSKGGYYSPLNAMHMYAETSDDEDEDCDD